MPDDISVEEFEYLLGLKKRSNSIQKSEQYKDDTRLYKTSPDETRIKQVHDYCEKTWGTRTPTILDAFGGGGSIPFEAARYGLNVLASDLNPVAVVTMKAAMEYPLKFGPDLQQDIDKWVQWVGDEAEKRLAEFFPSLPGEKVQNYLWAHTVVCPSCQSVVPLSPNWWLSKTSNYAGKGQARKATSDWYAVKPIPNPEKKRVDFELIKGSKGKGTTIKTDEGEFDPSDYNTISRGVGKCLNCGNVIEDESIKAYSSVHNFGHQLYAVAYKEGKSNLQFRLPETTDFQGFTKAEEVLKQKEGDFTIANLIPNEPTSTGLHDSPRNYEYGLRKYQDCFNPRQLLTLVTYIEIINDVKLQLQAEYEPDKVEAIATYLAFVLDRCADLNSRLSIWDSSVNKVQRASITHSLNLVWNYPEVCGTARLWELTCNAVTQDYTKLSNLFGTKTYSVSLSRIEKHDSKTIQIDSASADTLYHISDNSVDAIITDPPYYATIQYAELSDFFYVWQSRVLGDIFPNLYLTELTDKDREAVANPSRFRNMGTSPNELANQDYEAKMALTFAEHYRVLRDDGVMTVQFNHKESSAWDVLAKSLIDAGFEITASWAVSTENPQNLHQRNKKSISSTILLVCRKRTSGEVTIWENIKPLIIESISSELVLTEKNKLNIEDFHSKLFGLALKKFSIYDKVLDDKGETVRPKAVFLEVISAIANLQP